MARVYVHVHGCCRCYVDGINWTWIFHLGGKPEKASWIRSVKVLKNKSKFIRWTGWVRGSIKARKQMCCGNCEGAYCWSNKEKGVSMEWMGLDQGGVRMPCWVSINHWVRWLSWELVLVSHSITTWGQDSWMAFWLEWPWEIQHMSPIRLPASSEQCKIHAILCPSAV